MQGYRGAAVSGAPTPDADRRRDLDRLVADAEAWNAYAARMNEKAIAAGLVTREQVEQDRQATQAALDRLRQAGRVPMPSD